MSHIEFEQPESHEGDTFPMLNYLLLAVAALFYWVQAITLDDVYSFVFKVLSLVLLGMNFYITRQKMLQSKKGRDEN